jgi:hypothetical protein
MLAKCLLSQHSLSCLYFGMKLCWTDIAYDFIPLKANLKPEELEKRVHSHFFKVFEKDADSNGNGEDTEGIPLNTDSFKERLYSLRKLVLELAQVYIEEYFVTQFQKSYPNYTTHAGLTVKSSSDMLEAYSYEEKGPSNKMREMVYYCMNGMWEGNTWAAVMESKIMSVIQLRYSSTLRSCKVRVIDPEGKSENALVPEQ